MQSSPNRAHHPVKFRTDVVAEIYPGEIEEYFDDVVVAVKIMYPDDTPVQETRRFAWCECCLSPKDIENGVKVHHPKNHKRSIRDHRKGHKQFYSKVYRGDINYYDYVIAQCHPSWNPEDQTLCFNCGFSIPCLIHGFNICSDCYHTNENSYY